MGKQLGFSVCDFVANGKEGVCYCKGHEPDVVLMDIEMPEMDGLEASKIIQKECPTPIVILTSYTSDDLLKEASEAGVSAYLVKPPKANDLERAIAIARARHDDLMEQKRLVQQLKQARLEIQTLRGLLPICQECKMLQDENGNWHQMEQYIQSKSEAKFTHGLCPKCHGKAVKQFQA